VEVVEVAEVAEARLTDSTWMVAARASRAPREPVNRKRVQPVMRPRLLQRSRNSDRRRNRGSSGSPGRTGSGTSTWPKVWTAQHGWIYLYAIIDYYTREIVGRDSAATLTGSDTAARRFFHPGRSSTCCCPSSTIPARRFFTRALAHGPGPMEVTTEKAGPYLRVLDELVPAAAH
jgi:hypothetical protein